MHSPLQVPQKQLDHFAFINNTARRIYHAMVYYIDEAIGNITQELKSSGKWDNTLMVVHADNGGPIYFSGCCGGNNFPLKGGVYERADACTPTGWFLFAGLLATHAHTLTHHTTDEKRTSSDDGRRHRLVFH